MREISEWTVSAQAHHRFEAVASEAARSQGRIVATPRSAHSGARALARQRSSRPRQILRRAGQPAGAIRVPLRGRAALVSGAAGSQPAHTYALRAGGAAEGVLSAGAN